ncbi:MAG: hypothetical protein AAF549_05270 [Pseudomonadota bacterium]
MKREIFSNSFEISKGMKIALITSVIFHLSVVVIGMVGLPHISKPPVIPDQPLSVDIIDVSELTTTNKPPKKTKKPEPKKDDPPPKVEKKVEAAPKVTAAAPPKVKPTSKPKPPEEETKPPEPDTPAPPEEELAKVEEPEPEPPKEEPIEEKTVSEEDFLSVLKNLQDSEPAAEANPDGLEQTSPEESPLARFADRLSASEMDLIARALNQQFSSCWNLMAGARNAEDITVSINLTVRPDRTVQSARISDQLRYTTDGFFRAAADTALRAINHPNCEVLDLPPDKYSLWKELTFNFNPAAQL